VIQEGKGSKRSEEGPSDESNVKEVLVFKAHKAIPVLFCYKQVLFPSHNGNFNSGGPVMWFVTIS
jgi:hypothetical protein